MDKFKLFLKIIFSLAGLIFTGIGSIALVTAANNPTYSTDPEVYILIASIFLLSVLALFIAHLI